MVRSCWVILFLIVAILAGFRACQTEVFQFDIIDFVSFTSEPSVAELEKEYTKKVSTRIFVAFKADAQAANKIEGALGAYKPESWISFQDQLAAFSRYARLLAAPALLTQNRIGEALERMYEPGLNLYLSGIRYDPLFLALDTLGSTMPTSSSARGMVSPLSLHVDHEGAGYLLYQFQKSSIADMQGFVRDLNLLAKRLELAVFYTGAPLYAEHTRRVIFSSTSIISSISLFALVALVFIFYRSIMVALLVLATALASTIFGLALCILVFGSVHVIALGFGVSLIGLSADYAFHFFSAAKSKKPQSRFVKMLAISAMTSCAGYAALFFSEVPGISQLAVFTISGLLFAFGTVAILFRRKYLGTTGATATLLVTTLSNVARSFPGGKMTIYFLLSGLLFLPFLAVNDDVVSFNSSDSLLVEGEKTIRGLLESKSETVLVSATSTENLVTAVNRFFAREQSERGGDVPSLYEKLFAALAGYSSNAASLSNFLKEHKSALESFYASAGLSTAQIYPTATLDEALRDILATVPGIEYLTAKSGARGVVLHRLRASEAGREYRDRPHVKLFAPAREASSAIALVHRYLRQCLPVCLVLVFVILLGLFGGKVAINGLIPLLLAGSMVAVYLYTTGTACTIFHTLSAYIILGLGVDYAVFLHGSSAGSNSYAEREATLLSAISTCISLGLLALVPNPAIHYFGITMLIGILSVYIGNMVCLEE